MIELSQKRQQLGLVSCSIGYICGSYFEISSCVLRLGELGMTSDKNCSVKLCLYKSIGRRMISTRGVQFLLPKFE